MAETDFLSLQLRDAEGNLKTTATQQARKHHQDASASRGASVSTASAPTVDSQPDDSVRASGTGKRKQDWRRVNRRRRTHSLTFTDDTWFEMKAYAQRNNMGVSEMLTILWEKASLLLDK